MKKQDFSFKVNIDEAKTVIFFLRGRGHSDSEIKDIVGQVLEVMKDE